jgi:hypothetical protein
MFYTWGRLTFFNMLCQMSAVVRAVTVSTFIVVIDGLVKALAAANHTSLPWTSQRNIVGH